MEATRNSIPPSSLFFKRSENMRDTQGHPPHFRFMHHASSTPCFLSLPPSSHEIAREINKNPPPPPFFLSFPRTIRLPSASGFLARRIYGGRSRARFPSLAEKPTQYLLLLLLRRMEKFLPLFPLALDPRSRLVFEGGLRLIPPPFQIRTVQTKILSLCLSPPDIVESCYHCSGWLFQIASSTPVFPSLYVIFLLYVYSRVYLSLSPFILV